MKAHQSTPFCSSSALLAMPLFGIISIPFWRWHIDNQINAALYEFYSPDPWQFGSVAIAAGAVVTGLCGALVGLAFILESVVEINHDDMNPYRIR